MGAYGDLEQAIPGLLAEGIQNNASIKGAFVIQDSAGIAFGETVWGYLADAEKCYSFVLDVAKIVFDADFTATDSIVITVDGDVWTAAVWSTDHDTTMSALITRGTAEGYEVARDASDTNNRTIFIKKSTVATAVGTVTEAVTGGGNPTGTITYQTDQVFLGIAMYDAKNIATANSGKYLQYEAVNIVDYGVIWATNTGSIDALDDVYAVATTGVLTATAGLTINCKAQSDDFTNADTSDVLTKVEVRGIYKPYTDVVWV